VQSNRGYFSGYQDTIQQIEAIEDVVAASPVIYSQLAVQTKDSESIKATIYVKGIDLEREDRVTAFSDYVDGSVDFKGSPLIDEAKWEIAARRETIAGGIILGYNAAARMRVFKGDILRLISRLEPNEVMPGSYFAHIRNFVVIGFYRSGLYTYDDAFGFIDLETAQTLYDKKEQVNLIQVRVTDADIAPEVRRRIVRKVKFDEGLMGVPRTNTWMDSRSDLFSAMELEKLLTLIIEVLIIIVAAFNIASTLIMMVMEKTRDVGILRAMGASKGEIRKIFIIQGSIIGALGASLGTVLGVVLCLLLDLQTVRPTRWLALAILLPVGVQMLLALRRTFSFRLSLKVGFAILWLGGIGIFLYCLVQPIYLDSIFGNDFSNIYQLDRLPFRINWFFVAFINALSFAICWLATVYPAWQASNLNPVEALRYE
jgi:lipoprotein-releasing system permease protein